jgi:flagellar biosynthesis protein FliQ
MYKGVDPKESVEFTLAPFVNKNSAASNLQSNNDQYNGVALHFPELVSSILAPSLRSLLIMATLPCLAAAVNGVIVAQLVSCSKINGSDIKPINLVILDLGSIIFITPWPNLII